MRIVLYNSDGEEIKEMPFGKETNFDRITASPETLANYIGGVINYALRKESEKSKTEHKRYSNMFQGLGHAIEWLKQESDTDDHKRGI